MIYILKGMFLASRSRSVIEAFGAIQTFGWIITEDDANFNQLTESTIEATQTLSTLILNHRKFNLAAEFHLWRVATRLLRRTFIMRRFFQHQMFRIRSILGTWFEHWVNVPDMDIAESAIVSSVYAGMSAPQFAKVFSQWPKIKDSEKLEETVKRLTGILKSRELIHRIYLQKWQTTADRYHTKRYNTKTGAMQIS